METKEKKVEFYGGAVGVWTPVIVMLIGMIINTVLAGGLTTLPMVTFLAMAVGFLLAKDKKTFGSVTLKGLQNPMFGTEAVAFMEKKVGRGNIFSAVVHMDEKTPHLHLCFTPITEDGRLSAKEILGNRAQLSQWQDEFHAHMKKAFPVLKRGESALVTRRKHIPTWLFKQSVRLVRQQRTIEKAVSEIGVMNAGKKRDEILEMVGPYFARLERHLGQMQKYQATIDYLTQENRGLKEKVNSEKSIHKQMEVLALQKENEQLRRFVQSIPPEVRQALKEQQRQQKRDRGHQR